MALYYVGAFEILLWVFIFAAGLVRKDGSEELGKGSWFKVIGHTFLVLIGQRYDGHCREERMTYISKCSAAAWTLTLLPVSTILAAAVGKGFVSIFIIIAALIPAIYILDDVRDRDKKRREEIEYTLPRVVTKMSLLIRAGMSLGDAWNSVADAGDGVLYQLIREVRDKLSCNVSEYVAYKDFVRSCNVPMVERFMSNISRNRVYGNAGLEEALSEMATELWNERMHRAEEESVSTANKLMIPSMLIFIGIMILTSAPVLIGLTL